MKLQEYIKEVENYDSIYNWKKSFKDYLDAFIYDPYNEDAYGPVFGWLTDYLMEKFDRETKEGAKGYWESIDEFTRLLDAEYGIETNELALQNRTVQELIDEDIWEIEDRERAENRDFICNWAHNEGMGELGEIYDIYDMLNDY